VSGSEATADDAVRRNTTQRDASESGVDVE